MKQYIVFSTINNTNQSTRLIIHNNKIIVIRISKAPWIEFNILLLKIRNAISKHSKGYLVPTITSYWHTIRFALLYLIALQVITRIFLAAFYTAEASSANSSILYLENEVSTE